MLFGYARVSTTDQDLRVQLEKLNHVGCEKIYQEKVSGLTMKRPQLQLLLNDLREGDVLAVWKLDRLARSTRDLLSICDRIAGKKASFRSLSETWADTTSAGGKMILTIFAGIAEFERDLIVERTSNGRTAAQKRGVKFGRPSKFDENQINSIKALIKTGIPIKNIAKSFNTHPTTIYRLLNQ
jgi:DNA invertase Pin-like site-specific DNA recombinase